MTVSDMFDAYVPKLVPPAYDRTTVAARKQNIRAALEEGGVDIVNVFEAGSFSHGAGIKGKADVDLMVWASVTQQPQLPSSALSRFKTALSTYLSVQAVGVSRPVVKVEFWSPPHFEVVPAFYEMAKSGVDVYEIPGRRDEWVNSAPSAHNALVNAQNDRLSKKVKPLVRLVKAWKYQVAAPVSSFYLEMRVAEYAKGEQSIVYRIDVPAVLRNIVSQDVADMNDPAGIAGRIPACASDEKRRQAKTLMQTAIAHLDAAEECGDRGDASGYWSHMYDVFGSEFPYPTS